MGGIRQGLVVISVAAVLALQGCSLAQKHSDPESKHAALDRWNQCLQRFKTNTAHFCDGHRRDVLESYPAYLGSQVDSLLRRQDKSGIPEAMLKTGLQRVLDPSQPPTQIGPLQPGSAAE